MKPVSASCRLCFVEVEGRSGPLPACTVAVEGPLAVKTIRRPCAGCKRPACNCCFRCTGWHASPARLICAASCTLSEIPQDRFEIRQARAAPEGTGDRLQSPLLDYYPNRCVLCGKCVHVCSLQHRDVVLTFVKRGFNTLVGYYGLSTYPAQSCTTAAPASTSARWRRCCPNKYFFIILRHTNLLEEITGFPYNSHFSMLA